MRIAYPCTKVQFPSHMMGGTQGSRPEGKMTGPCMGDSTNLQPPPPRTTQSGACKMSVEVHDWGKPATWAHDGPATPKEARTQQGPDVAMCPHGSSGVGADANGGQVHNTEAGRATNGEGHGWNGVGGPTPSRAMPRFWFFFFFYICGTHKLQLNDSPFNESTFLSLDFLFGALHFIYRLHMSFLPY